MFFEYLIRNDFVQNVNFSAVHKVFITCIKLYLGIIFFYYLMVDFCLSVDKILYSQCPSNRWKYNYVDLGLNAFFRCHVERYVPDL